MTISFRAGLAAGVALLAALSATAQEGTPPCEVQSANGIIRVAVCGGDMTDEGLAEEGRRICGEDRPCGAWFWRDEADAPEEAPETHDGLAPEQVRSAMGVFVAEQDMVIRITRQDN
jgi:hypothetical protein